MRLNAAILSVVAPLVLCGAAVPQVATEIVCEDEKDCLAQLGAVASRTGEYLHLRLDNGQTKILTSDSAACERDDAEHCSHLTLFMYRPVERLFVVKRWGYDDGRYELIDRRTGDSNTLLDIPRFSPNGTIFAIVGHNPFMSNPDSYVEVWSLKDGKPVRTFSHPTNSMDESWEFVSWRGNDRVRIRPSHGGRESEIVRAKQGWRLAHPR